MKNKSRLPGLFFLLIIIIFIFILFLSLVSCKNITKKTEDTLDQQKSSGVISLLESLGVGDVPGYPGAVYDKELNEQLGEFRNQLEIPDDYINVFFTVHVIKGTPSDVLGYYNAELSRLEWEKSLDMTSGEGGFMLWKKISNRSSEISYLVKTGKIRYGSRNETVILTGMIIPDYGSEGDIYAKTTEKGSEIGPGEIYFKNPTTPQGQGLLQTMTFDMGIDEVETLAPGWDKNKR